MTTGNPDPWRCIQRELDHRFSVNQSSYRIAVFDLDNTLLIHDVGNAVFADLRARSLFGKLRECNAPLPLSWKAYTHLIDSGRSEEAYRRVVQAMAGLEPTTIRSATRRVMSGNGSTIEVEGFSVPTPRPDPRMTALLRSLEKMNFRIYIISASNQISVRTVAAEYFNLNPEHAWGITTTIRPDPRGRPTLTTEIMEPFPYGPGKTELFHLHLGNRYPLISAGDSESDIPLLNLTPDEGMIFWCGDTEVLKRRPSSFRNPGIVTFLPPAPTA